MIDEIPLILVQTGSPTMTKRFCDKGITVESECCYVVWSKSKLESKKLERKSQLHFKGGGDNLAALVIFFVVICVTKADGTGTNKTSGRVKHFIHVDYLFLYLTSKPRGY